MASSRDIEERAAEWLAKRDGGDWTGADEARLCEWLEASTLHRVAFLRLEAGWEQGNRLKALGAGLPRGEVPSVGTLEQGVVEGDAASAIAGTDFRTGREARRPWLAFAATLAVAVCGVVLLYTAGPWAADRYATPLGGMSTVPLKDGSHVTLNTASQIRVELTERERRIELAQGEAFFDVAKDPSRPFVVHAAGKRIVAVGTQFSVRKDGKDVQVVVTEGTVRLEDAEGEAVAPNLRSQPGADAGTKLTAGTMARATAGDILVQPTSLLQAEELLSWRTGYIVFREASLADAAAEFGRYNENKIVIRDPHLAAMRLTGKFRANNLEGFVRLLEESFPIEAQRISGQIVLTHASIQNEQRQGEQRQGVAAQ